MPPAVVAVAGGVLAGAVASSALIGVAVGLGTMALSEAIKPEIPKIEESVESSQRLQTSAIAPRRGIYGETVISGTIVGYGKVIRKGVDRSIYGLDLDILDEEVESHVLAIALAGHEVESLEIHEINGKPSEDAGAIAEYYKGDQTEASNKLKQIIPEWTSDHIGHGITYAVIEVPINPETLPQGLQRVTFKTKGRRVYDPRLDSTVGGEGSHRANDPTTWQWTDNPILCALDYMRFFGYKEVPISRFYLSEIMEQADVCDEEVTITDENGNETTEKRFTANGFWSFDEGPAEVLTRILNSCGGRPHRVGGKISLKAGGYSGIPQVTITDNDIRGDVKYRPFTPVRERTNAVRATYVEPEAGYVMAEAPVVTKSEYQDADGGYRESELRLPFTNKVTRAQRLQKMQLERLRAGFVLETEIGSKGLLLTSGMPVKIKLDRDNIDRQFVVNSWKYNVKKKTVSIVAQIDYPEIWTDDINALVKRPQIVIPDNTDPGKITGASFVETSEDTWRIGYLNIESQEHSRFISYEAKIAKANQELIPGQAYTSATPQINISGLAATTYGAFVRAKAANNRWTKEVFVTFTIGEVWEPEPGPPGPQGPQGPAGPQGVRGPVGPEGQAKYTWIRYADDGNGNGISNSPTGKEYVGFAYNKDTATESNTPSDYTWSKIKGETGPQGPQGVEGPKGPNGEPTYTWIKYSANADGSNPTEEPVLTTKYIGIATNKTTQTESSNPADYVWSRFKGEQGDQGPEGPRGPQGPQGPEGPQGVQGPIGPDGKTYYTWIKYADNASGGGLSNNPTGKEYIGFAYNKLTATESNNAADYTWTKIKGEKGNTGATGPTGPDGKTLYTWIKYSANANGSGMTDTPQANTEYIGIATNKESATESNTPSDYTWSKFKGEQGPQGVQGPIGPDGKTYYTWIRYADSVYEWSGSLGWPTETTIQSARQFNFSGATAGPAVVMLKMQDAEGVKVGLNGTEIGTAIGPNNATKWYQFPATLAAGDNTIQVWAPALDGGSVKEINVVTAISNSPAGLTHIGFAYNKDTANESSVIGDYIWSKIKGEKGNTGATGPTGPNGKTFYTWIKYSANANGAGMTDTPQSNTEYIGIAVNKEDPEESNNAADYTWSLFKGPQGETGNTGDQGPRGAGVYFGTTTGTSWSDAIANAATDGANVEGDHVTITNKTAGYVETRRWTGSAWSTDVGTVVDGNLVVNGYAIAEQIFSQQVNVTDRVIAETTESTVYLSAVDDFAFYAARGGKTIFAVGSNARDIVDGNALRPSSVTAESLDGSVYEAIKNTIGESAPSTGGVKTDSTRVRSSQVGQAISIIEGFPHGISDITLNLSFDGLVRTTTDPGYLQFKVTIQQKKQGTTSWVDTATYTCTAISNYEKEVGEYYSHFDLRVEKTINPAEGTYDFRIKLIEADSAINGSVAGTLKVSEVAAGTSTAWNKITGKPQTATRWPDISEVGGGTNSSSIAFDGSIYLNDVKGMTFRDDNSQGVVGISKHTDDWIRWRFGGTGDIKGIQLSHYDTPGIYLSREGWASFTADEGVTIQSRTNGAGARLTFSDHASGNYTQQGFIEYFHADGAVGTGSNDGFVIGGTEGNTVVRINGRLDVGTNTVYHTGNKPSKADVGLSRVENRAFNWQWGGGTPTHIWASPGNSTEQYVYTPNNIRDAMDLDYLESIGSVDAMPTGRTALRNHLHHYGTDNGTSNTPHSSKYGESIVWGEGTAGAIELWGGWVSGGWGRLYTRALRNVTDGWSDWYEVYTSREPRLRSITGVNTYTGIAAHDGNDGNWIRTTVNGFIPYQAGGASSLGTSSWPFNNVHSSNIYAYSQIAIDSTGHANFIIDRGTTSHDANIMFRTAGSTKWRLWLDGSDSELAFRHESSAKQPLKITENNVEISNLNLVGGVGRLRVNTSGTIAGANFDNGWLQVGDSANGWAIDPNEIYCTGTGIIGTIEGNLNLSPASMVQIKSGVRLDTSANSILQITNGSGWVRVGANNTSYAHFYTDRTKYYFDKEIYVDGAIRVYNRASHLTGDGNHAIIGPNYDYFARFSNSGKIARINTGWANNNVERDIFRPSWASNVGDYILLHATGNITTNGALVMGREAFAIGRHDYSDLNPTSLRNVFSTATWMAVTPATLAFLNKEAFRFSDNWLRINEDKDFSDGIYCGGSTLRTDGNLQVGSSGNAFNANTGQIDLKVTTRVHGVMHVKEIRSQDGNFTTIGTGELGNSLYGHVTSVHGTGNEAVHIGGESGVYLYSHPSNMSGGMDASYSIRILASDGASYLNHLDVYKSQNNASQVVARFRHPNQNANVAIVSKNQDKGSFRFEANADDGDLRIQTAGTNGGYLAGNGNVGTIARFYRNGSAYIAGELSTADTRARSDIRVKTKLSKIDKALEKVSAITGFTYDEINLKRRMASVIAQDVEKVLPEAVGKDSDGMLNVSPLALIGLLVNAVKELSEEVKEIRNAA